MDGPVDAKETLFHDGQPTEKISPLSRQVKVGRAKENGKRRQISCVYFFSVV